MEILKKLESFVVDRSMWLRGEGDLYSSLLRARDEKRCCIGQYCKQAGVPDSAMRDITLPYKLAPFYILEGFVVDNSLTDCAPDFDNTIWVNSAAAVNDDSALTDAEREEKLTVEFARQGIKVTFVDQPNENIPQADGVHGVPPHVAAGRANGLPVAPSEGS